MPSLDDRALERKMFEGVERIMVDENPDRPLLWKNVRGAI